MPTVAVFQHVPHERLGTLELPLREAGCTLHHVNIFEQSVAWPLLTELDGVIVMGGPMSVYQQTKYPFLTRELRLIEKVLARRLPILGVCLGAQLLAHALGASVTQAKQVEIGWYQLQREPAADHDALLGTFGETETVFQVA